MIPNMVRDLDDQAAVRTRGLVKRFKGTRALDGLELSVPEGGVYVLVGVNGAGKTTTLRALLDLVPVDRGEVEVFGLQLRTNGPQIRGQTGFVPDRTDFGYGTLRVRHLLEHHAAYYPSWDTSYARDLVRQLDIDLGRRFGKLSKGQARRVQLVLALAHRPALLLLDEPTDGLDPVARDRVAALLSDHLAAVESTVVVSTHHAHEVEGLADAFGALHRGQLLAQLHRSDLDRYLHRIRFESPEGWSEKPFEAAILRRRDRGRESEWTVWGEADELRQRLLAAGASVRSIDPVNLEQATRVLLAMGATEEAR